MGPYEGGCLCGGVRYEIAGPLDAPAACHCSMCARTSGNFAIMAAFDWADLKLASDETLAWFQSSRDVRRAFCSRCGGNLFWIGAGHPKAYVTTGTLARPTGLRLSEHIFIGSKSDVYDIADALPKKAEW